jgi:hypothetical protein
MLTFKPKNVTKKLLTVLPDRARDVLEKRYGLGADAETYTLESIGKVYGITRERVRQIENYGIQTIQKSGAYGEFEAAFEELKDAVETLGGVVSEQDLFNELTKDPSLQNHLYFMLVVGNPFERIRENDAFNCRWCVEKKLSETVEKAIQNVMKTIEEDDLVSEEDMLARLRTELAHLEERYHDEAILKRWLAMSKLIDRNPLGEWGHAASPNVNAKGIRDYAYLAVKRHGSPMHFKEVAEAIKSLFNKKAHVATTHNELIKDQRFVLVGRGLYALSEWGYSAGVVKDVLRQILATHGPLTRDEIVDKVRKERYVKDNTIIVNLQDTALFKKLPDGHYLLVE